MTHPKSAVETLKNECDHVSRRCSKCLAIFLSGGVALAIGVAMMVITDFTVSGKYFSGQFFSGWVACMAYYGMSNYLRQPGNGGYKEMKGETK